MHVPYIPGQYFFMLLGMIFCIQIIRNNMSVKETIEALNSFGNQPTAIIVLCIGCYMLIECKAYGLDATIAGGIIGVSSNMLTNQFAKQHAETATDGKKIVTDVTTNPPPPEPPSASNVGGGINP